MKNTHASLILLVIVGVCVGCAPYVNIPAQKGDFAMHDPNGKTVRIILLKAFAKVLADRPINQPFQVMLPVGTVPEVYAKLLPKISEHAMWSSDGQAKGIPVLRAAGVRIRGYAATVDIVMPMYPDDPDSVQQMVTVSMRHDTIEGWVAVRLRQWRGSVETATAQTD